MSTDTPVAALVRAKLWQRPRLGLIVVGLALVVLGLLLTREDWLGQGAVAMSLAIAATGLGVALGLAGEYLLGISFVVAAGAYPTAVLTQMFEWSFWPALVVGVICGVVVGLIVSLPGLRVSQFYFGMLGFFMVFLVPSIVEIFAPWTNGTSGMPVYNKPEIFGLKLDEHGMFILAAVGLTLALILVYNVRQSPWAVNMRRMRDAPYLLATTGVPAWRVRFSTYLLTSVLASLGGAIFSHVNVFLQPQLFTFNMTTLILAAVIVGGARTLLGPALGLVILYIVPRLILNIEGITDIVYGIIVIVSVLLFRGGVVQAFRDLWTFIRGRRGAVRKPTEDAVEVEQRDVKVADRDRLVELLMSFREQPTAQLTVVATGIRKSFDGVRALRFEDDDQVTISAGKVTLLLGPNGSGKTTLLNTVSGLVHADLGTISVGDLETSRLHAVKIAQAGLSRSFQSPVLPDELTPVDLFSALISQMKKVSYFHWLTGDWVAGRVRRASDQMAREIAVSAGLASVADLPCVGLTSGQRRLVDVAGAFISKSSVVLLDEPAAGLSDGERKLLASTVRGLADRGVGFVVVEHDLELALALADWVVVMAEGRPIESGTPTEIQHSEAVRRVLIGSGS